MSAPGPVQPSMPEVQLPAAYVSRLRRMTPVVGITVIVGVLLIYLVVLWLAPIIASGLSGTAVTVLCGLPTLLVVAIGITLLAVPSCLTVDRLVVERARRVRRTFVVLLICQLAATAVCAIAMVAIAEPFVDDLILTVMLFFVAMIGLLGYASGTAFIRPTTATLRRFGDRPVW